MRRFWILWLGLWLCPALRGAAQPNVTSYSAMTAQLQADAAHCPLLRIASLGQSAKAHRALWLVRVADPKTDPAKVIRLLVLCRQHGDEPASTEAVLSLVHRLARGGDPALRSSLAHVSLYLIPMVNPDGAEAGTRANGVGADLNRDWGVFHQPETRAVAHAVRLLRPNLVIDAHNWDGNDEYNADCLEIPRETATALGKEVHSLQQQSLRDLADCGYAVHPTAWGEDTDPRLAHRWLARQNILSALVETHSGDPTDQQDFQRRQGMYVALIHSLLRRYSVSCTAVKPKLDQLEGMASADTQEALLFPPPPTSVLPHHFLAVRRVPLAWLWPLGVYGLALWGSRRRIESDSFCPRENVGTPLSAGYYSFRRKRDGTDTKVRSGQRKAVKSPPR